MKKILKDILMALVLVLGFSSCADYLDMPPKGVKTPKTLADYSALLMDEYTNMLTNIKQSSLLLNDRFLKESNLNFNFLDAANYMWNESEDRIHHNSTSEGTYYEHYATISTCNLILENIANATEATQEEKNELAGYVTVVRAMCYYVLANYYADAYDEKTADTKLSVPLIESASLNAPYEQVSIKRIYEYMTSTVEEVLKKGWLPKEGITILHPSEGAAYAFLARVYLTMANYTKALEYADMALAENNQLYDWVAYYNNNKTKIETPNLYSSLPSPMGYDYVENYNFRHGTSEFSSSDTDIPVYRADFFEEGDAKALARWKYRVQGVDTFMDGVMSGLFNVGGMTTVEVYLIKAECLARNNTISDAMDVLDQVRKTRILPEYYAKLTAADMDEAMGHIMKTKRNEMILTIVPFADIKRLNVEGKWPVTLTKEVKGVKYTLSPDSHMWTMPFPQVAIKNAGNGTLTQNVSK